MVCRFLYDIGKIPGFYDRMCCLIFQVKQHCLKTISTKVFQTTFFETLSAIEAKINNILMICEQLVSGGDVHKVVALILAYGNYMNGGGARIQGHIQAPF